MRALPLAVLILLAPSLALAHPGHDDGGGFASGVMHPILGTDHLLAMVAVGLWAALAGGRAIWAYPVAFLAAMVAGGAVGAGAQALPVIEPMILSSVVVLGAVTALALRLPLVASVVILCAFGLAHGYAHGVEGPMGVDAGYVLGFVLATAGLHAAGLGAARLGAWPARVLGGGVALAGVVLAVAG